MNKWPNGSINNELMTEWMNYWLSYSASRLAVMLLTWLDEWSLVTKHEISYGMTTIKSWRLTQWSESLEKVAVKMTNDDRDDVLGTWCLYRLVNLADSRKLGILKSPKDRHFDCQSENKNRFLCQAKILGGWRAAKAKSIWGDKDRKAFITSDLRCRMGLGGNSGRLET